MTNFIKICDNDFINFDLVINITTSLDEKGFNIVIFYISNSFKKVYFPDEKSRNKYFNLLIKRLTI